MKGLAAHHTKIVCTIGPASDPPQMLERMLRAGMNIARINLAHGSADEHLQRIARIRAAAVHTGRRVAILADLPGPKLRIGELPIPLILKKGDTTLLGPTATEGRIPFPHPEALHALRPGDPVFLSDGFIELRVEEAVGTERRCRVMAGGTLLSNKGVNLPTVELKGGAITEADRSLLALALEAGVDAVGVSFVQRAADLRQARELSQALGHSPFLIAKIERAGAWQHIDEILEIADGIMVARGDLGVEVPIEEVAIIQKRLIRKARALGKPVITATQMLESMIQASRPTRAEVTDVANAILDGTDCVMLSEESATGAHPVEAVEMLARIAAVTEGARDELDNAPPPELHRKADDIEEVIAWDVRAAAERLNPLALVIPTETGATARRIARFHLRPWIVALSPQDTTCQRLAFSYGVHSVHSPEDGRSWEDRARAWLAEAGTRRGTIILTQGPSRGHPGGTNRLEIIRLEAPQTDH